MMDLDLRRRFFAEEIEAVCKLRSVALVEAFATVARERFLRPGPWTVLAESDFLAGSAMQTRLTPDADPARVYHNIVVAIDPARPVQRPAGDDCRLARRARPDARCSRASRRMWAWVLHGRDRALRWARWPCGGLRGRSVSRDRSAREPEVLSVGRRALWRCVVTVV
jgi:hypothetical protein